MTDHVVVHQEFRRCACGDKLDLHLLSLCLACRRRCPRADRQPIRWGLEAIPNLPVAYGAGFLRGVLIGLGVSLLAWLFIANSLFWLFRFVTR